MTKKSEYFCNKCDCPRCRDEYHRSHGSWPKIGGPRDKALLEKRAELKRELAECEASIYAPSDEELKCLLDEYKALRKKRRDIKVDQQ